LPSSAGTEALGMQFEPAPPFFYPRLKRIIIMTMRIRKTKNEDISSVLAIYQAARLFMARNGNPTQWTIGAPDLTSLQADIQKEASFVVVEGEKILGTFALYHRDPNYQEINGFWLNDEPYVVVHRIASIQKGVGTRILRSVCNHYKNVRIDTHKNNIPMRNLLQKLGFIHCGTILLLDKDNSPREAYMKVNSL
jgi:RimJ/RimL family protein N-acetyltransferase